MLSGNLLKHIKVNKGDIQQGFKQAELIFEETFFTPTYEHAFMEPECSIARVAEDGRIEVYVGSQIPYADREQVAAALDLPQSQLLHLLASSFQTVCGTYGHYSAISLHYEL